MFYLDKNGLAYLWRKIKSALNRLISTHKEAYILDHPDGSVTTKKLAEGAVTKEKIAKDVIPTSLPASDVYDWAKQPEKPKYTAAEVGALPYDTEIPSYSAATQIADGLMSAADKKKLDGLSEGGGGGITEETDPTVPSWAKQSEKPKYTAAEVGADSTGSAASALSDAKTYIDEKVKTNVPENAVFTDTVYDDTEIKAALNNEATARANGDGALQDSLSDHMNDTSNPHSVTKSQVGLGNVPNVATNDQTPTYTQASTLANLTSGEKLSVSLGKIMKAIADFITHKGSTSNPHSVTKSQVGLGNVDNTSDANKPISTAVQNALNGKLDGSWSDANGYANIAELSLAAGDAYNTVFGSLGSDNEFAGIYELANQVSDNRDAIDTKAPKSHASTATTYGIGTSSNYGHVKLSDSTSTTSGASSGIAATPTAVKAAYDKANIKKNSNATDGDIISTHLTVGTRTTDSTIGTNSFASGYNNTASGSYTVALGCRNTASGSYAVALGYHNTASGNYAVALGYENTASGANYASVALGTENTASGMASVALGYKNTALSFQTKLGRYATDGTSSSNTGTTGDVLTVGIGTSSARKNGFRVDYSGNGYFYKAVSGTGADYAEMWEWQDGNPNSEDRVGYFVAFDGDKIRFANENDDLRKVGIISGNPAIIGDNFADDWQGMYLQDIYGRNITEHKSYEAEYDSEGNLIHEAYEADEYVLNPN